MNLYRAIGNELNSRGGHLKCQSCPHRKALGNTAKHLKSGFPICHGKEMEWILPKAGESSESPSAAEAVK